MANVGSGDPGKTLIGNGNGQGPKYADLGTNSGLTAHGVLVGEGNNPIQATAAGLAGQVLQSGGASSNPVYSTATYPSLANVLGTIMRSNGLNWTRTSATYPSTIITGQVLAGSASDVISAVAAGTTGQVFIATTNSAPSWGTAPVAGGGTGAVTLTNHGVLVGQGTSAIAATAAGTAGQVLQSGGASADPSYSTATYPSTAGSSGNVLTSNGTNWSSSAPAASSLITSYIANGSWTINANTKVVQFFVWGGGGGGGSGRCGASGSSGGGAGGGAGSFFTTSALAANITGSPYTITIGTGGTGGISINATTTNGNPGNPGNPTSIGSLYIAPGGLGGGGGTSASASGGSSSISTNGLYLLAVMGTGINGVAGVATSGSTVPIIYGYAGGGGGASGYGATVPRIGGSAPAIVDGTGSTLVAGGLAGANTGATAGNGNPPTGTALMIGATGGGGGGHDGTVTAGTGGNGAQPGGGGGGGAGNLSLNASGAGGNGGDGKVIIIEYF